MSNGTAPTGTSAVNGGSIPPVNNNDREAFGRWRDRQYFGPRRWFQSTRDDVQWEKEQDLKNKKDLTSGFPLWVSDDLEFWHEKEQVRFTQIASLYSEFIGVSTKGELHQWKWSDAEPYKNHEVIKIKNNNNIFTATKKYFLVSPHSSPKNINPKLATRENISTVRNNNSVFSSNRQR